MTNVALSLTHRVLVAGGRDYADWERVRDALDSLHKKTSIQVLAHGDCRTGADALASRWAEDNAIQLIKYPAPWRKGDKAGPQRSKFMIDDFKPSLVLLFPGNRGTMGVLRLARARKIPIVSISEE